MQTVEIPTRCSARPRRLLHKQGASLKDLLTEAVRDLRNNDAAPKPANPWISAFGGLDLHRERKRLERVIQCEFEHMDEGE